jgi:hypothetical protein
MSRVPMIVLEVVEEEFCGGHGNVRWNVNESRGTDGPALGSISRHLSVERNTARCR